MADSVLPISDKIGVYLRGVVGMRLYRVDTALPVHLPTPLLFQPFLVYGFRK